MKKKEGKKEREKKVEEEEKKRGELVVPRKSATRQGMSYEYSLNKSSSKQL